MKPAIKQFFAAGRAKVYLCIVLGFILHNLLVYSVANIDCFNPPCKDPVFETIGFVMNIVPLVPFIIFPYFEFSFPIQFLLVMIFYFVIPWIWYYFLSCLIVWTIDKLKKKYPFFNKNAKIIISLFVIFLAVLIFSYTSYQARREKPMGLAMYAVLRSYLGQMRYAAAVWESKQSPKTYVGFTDTGDGQTLKQKIEDIAGADNYNEIISDAAYCAKAKRVGTAVYWCVDSASGYSGTTTDQYCTAEKPYCSEARIAKEKQDPAGCEEQSTQDLRDKCYWDFAKVIQDQSVCEKILGQWKKDECINSFK